MTNPSLLVLLLAATTVAQTVPDPCDALVPGTPIAATNSAAPTVLALGATTTVQIEILGHSENRGYHTFLQQMLSVDPPLPGVTFVVTNRWIGGHQAFRWAAPGNRGYQAIDNMLAARQHPTIVLGLFSNNVSFPIQSPTSGDPNFDTFVSNLADIADHCHDGGNGAAMVYLSSHRYKPSNVQPAFFERAAVEHLVGTVAAASNRHWVKAGPEQHDLHWCCHPNCYAPDNAHTNAQGDALMAEAWYSLLWRELRGCSSEPFGTGTAGTAGAVPVLSPAGGLPVLGNGSFGLRLHDIVPNALVVYGIGGPSTAAPLLSQPFVTWFGLSDAQREHTLTFGLPTSAAFHGLELFAQGGVADPAGTYFGFALSQGLRITVCQ